MLPPTAIPKILQLYGIAGGEFLAVQKGYRNQSHVIRLPGGELQNIIVYKSEPGITELIQNANAVGDFVAAAGLPARQTVGPRIVQLQAGTHQKYAALYRYLPGHTIPWEAYTKERIKNLGYTMGNMHAVLARFDARPLPDAAQQNTALNQRMHNYFNNAGVRKALRKKLAIATIRDDFAGLHEICHNLPNQQALHLDFVRGNVLFDGPHVCGIIDFEKTARGHRLLDVARTLSFLLVDCKYKTEPKIRKYFLQSGYKKRGGQVLAKPPEILEELVNFYLLHDFYKFLRHNPYESLSANHHFMRTAALLRKRGIIG